MKDVTPERLTTSCVYLEGLLSFEGLESLKRSQELACEESHKSG